MKKYTVLVMIIGITLLIGCVAVSDPAGSLATVPDLFVPTTNLSITVSDSIPTEPSMPGMPSFDAMFPGFPNTLGNYSQKFREEPQPDETGRKCFVFQGEEVTIPFQVEGCGLLVEHGVGFLLFVDGKPQPYRTSANGEYSYVHGFKKEDCTYIYSTKDPETGENMDHYRLEVDFIFEPVAGEKGDYLECKIVRMYYPDYSQEKLGDYRIRPYTLANKISQFSFLLKITEDIPHTQHMPVADRLYDWELITADVSAEEIEGWTDDDMLKKVRTKCYVNGVDRSEHNGMFWNVTKDDVIEVRFEVYGSPLLEFSLVYFINNRPVSVSDEDFVTFRLNNGQKTIFTAKLDISDFDGETHIYCVLVARNRVQGVTFTTIADSYVWLRDIPDPFEEYT